MNKSFKKLFPLFVAGLLSAGGMGLWHGVEHYEKMKINERSDVELFVKAWPKLLADNTEFKYDWSYIVSWVGVGMTLCSSILFALAAVCIKNDKEREEAMNMQYLMPGKMTFSPLPFLPAFLLPDLFVPLISATTGFYGWGLVTNGFMPGKMTFGLLTN